MTEARHGGGSQILHHQLPVRGKAWRKMYALPRGLKADAGDPYGYLRGQGREGDIELLERLGRAMQDASPCSLGKTAANPVLTTIQYFQGRIRGAYPREEMSGGRVCKGN